MKQNTLQLITTDDGYVLRHGDITTINGLGTVCSITSILLPGETDFLPVDAITAIFPTGNDIEEVRASMDNVIDNDERFENMHRCAQTLQEGDKPDENWATTAMRKTILKATTPDGYNYTYYSISSTLEGWDACSILSITPPDSDVTHTFDRYTGDDVGTVCRYCTALLRVDSEMAKATIRVFQNPLVPLGPCPKPIDYRKLGAEIIKYTTIKT